MNADPVPPCRAAFTDPAPLPPCFNVLLPEVSIGIRTISPKGAQPIGTEMRAAPRSGLWWRLRRHSPPRHGTDHDSKPLLLLPGVQARGSLALIRQRGSPDAYPARPLQRPQNERRSGRTTAQGFGRSLRWHLAAPVSTNSPNGALSSSPYGAVVLSPSKKSPEATTHTDQSSDADTNHGAALSQIRFDSIAGQS
jgi:hypothetical protein